jgi:hypothetical protein
MKAFPIDVNTASIDKWQGMDLRDYFAAKALTQVIDKWTSASPIGAAELAYQYADAMMVIRDMDPADYGREINA